MTLKPKELIFLVIILLPGFSAFAESALKTIGTFHNMSLEYKAPRGVGAKANIAHVQFSISGSEIWQDALELYYNEDVDLYAGSVVNLQPGTTYIFRLKLDSGERAEVVGTTWSNEFPIEKTIYLPRSSTETLHISSSGSGDGYIVYTYDPAIGAATLDGEGRLDYNIEIADSVHHVIIDGLNLKNVIQNNILIGDYCNNIVIQNNELSFWGRNPYENANAEGAISDKSLPSHLEKIVIQNNYIHTPNYPSWTWEVAHPQGPSGIMFRNSRGNHVIRNNTIEGSDSNYLAYGLRGAQNYSFVGGFGYNTDIYGNYISKTWGAAIECEGGNRNNRIYKNFTEHTFVHIAVAVNSLGPLYVFRNISGITRRDAKKRNSDLWGRSVFLKTGGGDSLEVKRIYLFNNLTLQPPPVGGGRRYGSGVQKAWNDAGARTIQGQPKEIVAFNNIFRRADGFENNSIGELKADEECNNIIDYNMFLGKLPASGNCQFQKNGIALKRGEHPQWDIGNGTNEHEFLDRKALKGTFYLASGAPGQGDGKSIPNFLPGAQVDMGPHQRGEVAMTFGCDCR